MAQKQPEDPLSNPGHTTDMLKSGFSRRPNPYATLLSTSTELNKNPNKPPDVEMKSSSPLTSQTSQPPQPKADTISKPFATTSFSNPFQAAGSQSPENRTRSATSVSFVDMTTTSPMNQNAYFVANNRVDLMDLSRTTPRRPQPILFGAGGAVQPAVVQPPKKEPLKGIYAFFGSEELPIYRQVPPADMPQGLEAIPFIFKNHCYGPGLDVVDYFMKRTTNADEKMYFRIIKLIFIMKLHMWDKMNLEFDAIGNMDKLIFETSRQVYLPYHLRLLYALNPYFTSLSQTSSKSHSTANPPKQQEDKALERLFSLLSFCEGFVKTTPYPQNELSEGEQTNIQSLCDTEVSEQSKTVILQCLKAIEWVARIFRVCLIILEILLAKSMAKLAHEFIGKALEKFPDNALLMSYQARLKMLQGEYSQAKTIFETVTANLPQDEYLEFIAINTFIQTSQHMSFNESESLIQDIMEKYPKYVTLATNNLFYIQFAQCKIKEAIETLEKRIRQEPWNLNEVIVANLLTAYDFYYVDSKERKKVINEIIDKYVIEFNKAAIAHELKA